MKRKCFLVMFTVFTVAEMGAFEPEFTSTPGTITAYPGDNVTFLWRLNVRCSNISEFFIAFNNNVDSDVITPNKINKIHWFSGKQFGHIWGNETAICRGSDVVFQLMRAAEKHTRGFFYITVRDLGLRAAYDSNASLVLNRTDDVTEPTSIHGNTVRKSHRKRVNKYDNILPTKEEDSVAQQPLYIAVGVGGGMIVLALFIGVCAVKRHKRTASASPSPQTSPPAADNPHAVSGVRHA